ncbi:hypothetical protein C8F01DRAFT_750617 [Mycena amicta]|nr:hypothetical protein C8F01DRAFT_750617 [Mycena amicta]
MAHRQHICLSPSPSSRTPSRRPNDLYHERRLRPLYFRCTATARPSSLPLKRKRGGYLRRPRTHLESNPWCGRFRYRQFGSDSRRNARSWCGLPLTGDGWSSWQPHTSFAIAALPILSNDIIFARISSMVVSTDTPCTVAMDDVPDVVPFLPSRRRLPVGKLLASCRARRMEAGGSAVVGDFLVVRSFDASVTEVPCRYGLSTSSPTTSSSPAPVHGVPSCGYGRRCR